jgi:crotonobetainyl-CoA:carnitine CoA-transferase CaiB-like acyl-CoA transferase
VAAANDGLYRRLCGAIGRPELADDERYATNDGRVRNREALVAELESVFAARSAAEWLRVLLASGVPAGEIRGVRTALAVAGSATITVPHPTAGSLPLVRPPFSFSRASLDPPEAPPLLGQHTAEVLAELGVDEDRLAALERRGVIARPAPA